MRLFAVAAAVMLPAIPSAFAQTSQPVPNKTDAEVRVEAEQAQSLYDHFKMLDALPLYEDLHRQRPQNVVYEERLAMTVLALAGSQEGEARVASNARAKQLLLDAKAHGDNSPLAETLLEKMAIPTDPVSVSTNDNPGMVDFNAAEKKFAAGDLKSAQALYEAALEKNPKFFQAALYAGDSAFKLGDCQAAGGFYARAITIAPDEETAYRYWADCLAKQHENARAEQMYIKALVAQPYQRTTRQSLKTWADANHAIFAGPPISLPKRAVPDANGNTQINVDPPSLSDPASSVWLVYAMTPTVWQKGAFARQYPNEKTYRHSLGEESQALHMVVSTLKDKNLKDSQLTPTLRSLLQLDRDGMLECYILLDAADQGIAQDYVAYRKDHRDLLAQYIAKYDIHPM